MAVPSPSGVRMPLSVDGWRVTLADDFADTAPDPMRWTRYNGQSKSVPPSQWSRERVTTAGGVMTILSGWQDGEWLTGGLSSGKAGSQLYGRWDIRFRIDKGDRASYAILLYPEGGGWPPEIDIAEDAGGDRQRTTSTLHYDSDNKTIQRQVDADFSQWHTIGVIWSESRLEFTLDGIPYGVIEGAAVPSTPMWLGMQTGRKPCVVEYDNCSAGSGDQPVALQVDWVVRYEAIQG